MNLITPICLPFFTVLIIYNILSLSPVRKSIENIANHCKPKCMLFNRRTQAAMCIVKTYDKATTLQRNVGILCRRKQEERKSCNRNFKAVPVLIIRAGQMELGSRALPGFKCWRAVVNSLCEKFSLIFTWFGVVALQKSDTS